jgi:hypothetical protein
MQNIAVWLNKERFTLNVKAVIFDLDVTLI